MALSPKKCFTCSYCNYITDRKNNYERHIVSPKHKELKEIEDKKCVLNCICPLCGQQFKTHKSMRRHEIHRCENRDQKKIEFRLFVKQQREKEKAQTQSNNSHINKYGSESLNHITNKMKTRMLRYPGCMIKRLIQKIHFHSKHPENCNIRIKNINSKFIEIFDGIKWIFAVKREIIIGLIDTKYGILYDYFDDNGQDVLCQYEITRNINYQDRYETQEKQLMRQLFNDIESVVINNTH